MPKNMWLNIFTSYRIATAGIAYIKCLIVNT